MVLNFLIVVSLLKLLFHNIYCTDEPLNFKIALPEYICDKNGSVRELNKDVTTIRLLGKDAQILDYKFDVNFKRIGSDCRNNQRCNLIIWKAVRELDKYLKDYPAEEKQTGLIEIKNDILLPGIEYILNVTILNNGTMLEEKQMTLDYVDEDVKKLVKEPMASMLLLGSDTAYAYRSYVINAEITICSNLTGYFFHWELFDESMTSVQEFSGRGSELIVPPNTFQALKSYTIRCDLVDMKEEISIADSLQTVTVLSKGLLLKLPFKTTIVEINQFVSIKPFIQDLDNSDGDIKVKLTCTSTKTCDYKNEKNDSELEFIFFKEGKFKLTFEISKGTFQETDSCEIHVRQDVPTIEFDEIPQPVSPSKGVKIVAYVYKLRTLCTLQWTSVKDANYEFLELNRVPGHVNEIINVTLKEDLFLHELEEFSNGTIDKEHDLTIPPPQDSWQGLKGDVNYLFRLNVTCPAITEDIEGNDTDVELILEPSQTLLSDITIETNAGPVISPLEVNPSEGLAFATTFSFKTQKAKDKPEDGPLLYQFGYILDDEDVIIWSLCDVTNTETILPYSDGGIKTILIVCDNFESCNRIDGPIIKTILSKNITKDYNEDVLKIFEEKINCAEYHKAFTFAHSLLHSYGSNGNSDTYKEAHILICELINNEIQRLLDNCEDEDNEDDECVNVPNELIKNINEFNKKIKFSEEILTNILNLRNMLSNYNTYDISEDSENMKRIGRNLLNFNRPKRDDLVNLNEIKHYIEISELFITNSNDSKAVELEKSNLRKQIPNYMSKLCDELYKKPHISYKLELKTLQFSVEKFSKFFLNNSIIVSYDKNNKWQASAFIKLTPNQLIKEEIKNKKLCIGKGIFQDYFHSDKGIAFLAEIINRESSNDQAINKIDSVTVIIGINSNKQQENSAEICVVYYDGWKSQCKLLKKTEMYVKCSCNYLGYYLLEYQQNGNSKPIALETTTIPSNESENSQFFTTPSKYSTTFQSNNNISTLLGRLNDTKSTENNYDVFSYIAIGASIIGIIILICILKKISADENNDEESLDNLDFPKYAQLYNEETLCDAHI